MSPYDDYLEVAAEWEAEFSRLKREYGEKIHCRKGCTDCCSQMFQITEVEAAYISRAVKQLPPDEGERMRARISNRRQHMVCYLGWKHLPKLSRRRRAPDRTPPRHNRWPTQPTTAWAC